MRVTNSMITKNYLTNLNANMTTLSKYQTQMASGKRITTISDDPVGVLRSMQYRVNLYRSEQYQKNVDTAKSWLTQAETSVMELNSVITSAYESSIQASSAYITDQDKAAVAEMIGQLRDQVVTLANSQIGDKYIFGGYNTLQQPFKVDQTTGVLSYNGLDLSDDSNPALLAQNDQNLQLEIGFGLKTDVSMPGTKLLGTGDDNIYAVLDGLYKALKNGGSPQEIAGYSSKLQNAQSDVLSLAAEIGGRSNRLDLVNKRYDDDILNYTEMKSNVEDVDAAEIIMQYKMAEFTYLAALKTGNSIIQPSLVDYLN
ncbi:MAG: flagellar hook-associated protein FlgL [Bacillota bacterium]